MFYAKHRNKLIELGYTPLPIVSRDKNPALKGWMAPTYTPPVGYGGCGVGVICGAQKNPIAAVDIDILDKGISEKLVNEAFKLFGASIYRVGRAPKTLIVYRTATPFRKMVTDKYSCGRIEVLGAGQQFVGYGIHPETKMAYDWQGLIGELIDTPYKDLPLITEEGIRDLFDYFYNLMGGRVTQKLNDDFSLEDPLALIAPVGMTLDHCKRILNALDPDCSRDQWRNIGMALHFEFKGSPEALSAWESWSANGAKYKEGEPEKQWASFGNFKSRPITGAYLIKLGKEAVANNENFFKTLNWSTERFVENPPEIPMVVEGMMPKGIVSLFYSAGGAGKSTILLYLAVRIALANNYDVSFFGKTVRGGRVVVLTAEDPDLILNRRYMGVVKAVASEMNLPVREILDVVKMNLSLVSTFGHSVQLFKVDKNDLLTTTGYFDSLVQCLDEIQGLQLVVVDTKTRFSPGEGLGNVTATQEITYYESIALRTTAHVMLLHHSNKSSRDGSQTGMQAYRDATAIFDSVRAAWYLRALRADELLAQGLKESDKNCLLLENSKNNYIQCVPDMILVRNGYSYTAHEPKPKLNKEEAKERKKQQIYDSVIVILQNAKGAGFTQAEIIRLCREGIGIGRRVVVEVVEQLFADGMLDRSKDKIVLTNEGKIYNLEMC